MKNLPLIKKLILITFMALMELEKSSLLKIFDFVFEIVTKELNLYNYNSIPSPFRNQKVVNSLNNIYDKYITIWGEDLIDVSIDFVDTNDNHYRYSIKLMKGDIFILEEFVKMEENKEIIILTKKLNKELVINENELSKDIVDALHLLKVNQLKKEIINVTYILMYFRIKKNPTTLVEGFFLRKSDFL